MGSYAKIVLLCTLASFIFMFAESNSIYLNVEKDKTVESRSFQLPVVVEHAVSFNMPSLESDQEALILQGLYDLQFEFEDMLQLSVGRIFTNTTFCTHALIIRFRSIEVLHEFYNSAAKATIATEMTPFLQDEYTADYTATVTDDHVKPQAVLVHLTLLLIRADTLLESVEDMFESLSALAQELDYIIELTAGSNMYVSNTTDLTFSHAFIVYLPSVEALEWLQNDSTYLAILQNKVLPICSEIQCVDFLTNSPEQSVQ